MPIMSSKMLLSPAGDGTCSPEIKCYVLQLIKKAFLCSMFPPILSLLCFPQILVFITEINALLPMFLKTLGKISVISLLKHILSQNTLI